MKPINPPAWYMYTGPLAGIVYISTPPSGHSMDKIDQFAAWLDNTVYFTHDFARAEIARDAAVWDLPSNELRVAAAALARISINDPVEYPI